MKERLGQHVQHLLKFGRDVYDPLQYNAVVADINRPLLINAGKETLVPAPSQPPHPPPPPPPSPPPGLPNAQGHPPLPQFPTSGLAIGQSTLNSIVLFFSLHGSTNCAHLSSCDCRVCCSFCILSLLHCTAGHHPL